MHQNPRCQNSGGTGRVAAQGQRFLFRRFLTAFTQSSSLVKSLLISIGKGTPESTAIGSS